MQKDTASSVTFRATRLWDEAIRLFTNGMPSKRHRNHMRVYENCFTGSEAIKWFHQALEMNPHFNSVITQDKTMQLLSKFYEEGIFVKAKGSSKERQGPDRFKPHGIYQMGSVRPQYTARTPLSVKNNYHNQKGENWIRKSLHKEPYVEYENLAHVTKSRETCKDTHGVYQNMPPIKQRLVSAESGMQSPASGKVSTEGVHKRVAQHPIQFLKQYSQLQDQRSTQPQRQPYTLPETDDIWRKIFLGRLQTLLKDVDVSGLFWPCAVIRCQWLEQNCCILEDTSVAKFPPWVAAACSRLMTALGDKSLNRSIVNGDIEADVSALEAFFSSLQSPLIPADLSAIFQRVFLHLELAASSLKDDDTASHSSLSLLSKDGNSSMGKSSENLKRALPPNTCFETAFTSESPVTRIVPQSSFDTLHLPPRPASASACPPMKRNASAPKLLETIALEADSADSKPSAFKSSASLTSDKFGTIGGTRWQFNSKLKGDSFGDSLHSEQQKRSVVTSDSNQSKIHHHCGKLTVMDKTPPLPRRHPSKPPPLPRKDDKNKHTRSSSGGYINLALQDSFEGTDLNHKELDIEAAMETLQKLMICSQKTPTQHSPRKDGVKSMHVRSASLSQAQPHGTIGASGMRRSQSCWSHDMSNVSLSSYHTAISSSSSSLDSEVADMHSSNDSLNLTAGCEWGWDWGSDAEHTGVAVFRLLMLLVKPQSRAQLQVLLRLMGLLPYQCPYTTLKVLDMFSSFIIQGGDEDVTSRLLGFLVRHQKEIFTPPQELASEVQKERKLKMKLKERAAVTFCERVSLLQFEEQKLTSSQKALAELLDQIIADQKMSSKEKTKKLKMFKDSYPHIYSMRFPQPEMITFKKRNKSILQLARLRSLRV